MERAYVELAFLELILSQNPSRFLLLPPAYLSNDDDSKKCGRNP